MQTLQAFDCQQIKRLSLLAYFRDKPKSAKRNSMKKTCNMCKFHFLNLIHLQIAFYCKKDNVLLHNLGSWSCVKTETVDRFLLRSFHRDKHE